MIKYFKTFISFVMCISLVFSLAVISFADALPSPDWVEIVNNDDGTKSLVIKTPEDKLSEVDYYEVSFNGGAKWQSVEKEGAVLFIQSNSQIIVRYYKNNLVSEEYTASVVAGNATLITSESTGIGIVIPENSSLPVTVSISAYEIINGQDYYAASEAIEGSDSIKLYNTALSLDGNIYNYNGDVIWMFPTYDGENAKYCSVYYIDDSYNATKLDTEIQLNYLFIKTDKTGLFAVVENAASIEKGDVNGDGSTDAADARLTLRAAAKLETLTERQKKTADIDSDSKVTSADARKILRFSAGLSSL